MEISKRTRNLLIWALLAVLVGYSWYNGSYQTASVNKQAPASTSNSSKTRVCGADLGISYPTKSKITQFARNKGIRYPSAFANTVGYIRLHHRLPDCYLTKEQARKRGWRPGGLLWKNAPGHSIGGDYFGNRENKLPNSYNGQYVEADVDYDGRRRGAHRLLYAKINKSTPPIWLTTDHYRRFFRVPK